MTVQHNIGPEDRMIAFELSRLMTEKAKKSSADGVYRSSLSRLEQKGLNLKAAKDAIKIAEKGETAETVEYLHALTRYLKILRIPLKRDQLDLFETAPAAQPLEERAFEDGLGAGLLGYGQDKNPHDLSTSAGQHWQKGWNEGCASRNELQRQADAEEFDEEGDDEAQGDLDAA